MLDCYPEVPAALSELKDRGFEIAILSNGTPTMLEAAVKNSGLEELIPEIFSVEQVVYSSRISAYIRLLWLS
jgi:2-haloacid dehalogenase